MNITKFALWQFGYLTQNFQSIVCDKTAMEKDKKMTYTSNAQALDVKQTVFG